ncbi:2-succinyl-6-hydroxy-2,4-cyclohexadiene-1-carboxylate synthase [Xenorhabdus budapestensis]|uniref:2-succinyl-6-hydroxy-2,4-cyclohexadiene-1-carboxylate synthase n=1 Tax=Xenorhabdus budapestensis TaxID=290110 RepID=A0A2D0J199_XENBU|nr:2-succinyl-6-hydroxy-2,4-cyclohexadiene-1-carboxylate synthase [Xenorhabdus budapestensis]PHM28075.1 2-succinyl-6-hydroxy-2, 4-cyclohexadiene-1-carboxylate synthase [Xenorhabdus budapestensis]
MKLACQIFNAEAVNVEAVNVDRKSTWLVWLHGLLGSGNDWLPIVNACNQYTSLVIDFPGHGNSADITITGGFAEMSKLLNETLLVHQIHDYWLIGYSLGGRIAMYHATQNHNNQQRLRGILVEGGNPGLFSQQERDARLLHDRRWVQRFREEPMLEVLADWYQQPVFADLSPEQRLRFIHLRRQNRGSSIAGMLENTSLGHQPWLVPALQKLAVPFVYLCGEHDQKFKEIVKQYALPSKIIPQAGHNAHSSNPAGFSAAVNHFLSLFG